MSENARLLALILSDSITSAALGETFTMKELGRLCEILRSGGCPLEELDYYCNCDVGNKIAVETLALALRCNRSLRVLSIHGKLEARNLFVAHICKLPSALEYNRTLQNLTLKRLFINDHDVLLLSTALKGNHTLTHLDLSENEIHDDGVVPLARVLQKNDCTLTHLNLAHNLLGPKAVITLAAALQTNKSLTTLDLKDNDTGTDSLSALAAALTENHTVRVVGCRLMDVDPSTYVTFRELFDSETRPRGAAVVKNAAWFQPQLEKLRQHTVEVLQEPTNEQQDGPTDPGQCAQLAFEPGKCVACLETPACYIVEDCNHLCYCEACVEHAPNNSRCPRCSQPARKRRRIYL